MDAFLAAAASLLETAHSARRISGDPQDFSIFLEAGGQVHIVSGRGGDLGSMAQHYGARAAYRVAHLGGRTSVEAVAGPRRCRLGDAVPQAGWLQNRAAYNVVRLLKAGV